ncbi:hypothetical protein [Flavobacterium reichenbachii]|uniref:Uncharacterized protein n=1 Tax=Flavobacterium reichenbachii TaxID=362418 RepID=A0A085ZQ55_9FLAO|nr:hypothetical protein [Flavobacterium reichenbachii]KFF06569.1 hypothetical protein IW19_14090 [Flavobacterium reichenbachii]OXB18826.1 hypothetical protein B0A68_02100 [Flavobacterium reichenbachii]
MNNEIKTSDNIAGSIRLIGSLILIGGIVLLGISQIMEINVEPNSENMNAETLLELPKKIADKTNFTLLGGLLIIVGLQLSFISNQVIAEIKEQFKKSL